MKYVAFKDADSGFLVSMVLISDDNSFVDTLHSQLRRARAAGLLDGVSSVLVAETDDVLTDPEDMDWKPLFPNLP